MTIATLKSSDTLSIESIRILTDLTVEVGGDTGRVTRDDSITLITQLTPLRRQRQGPIPVLGSHRSKKFGECSFDDS